jgi:Lrp/AsnC family leucine-responsive transcriptional regulator
VRRLEQRGVVKGYTAKLDHQALGQQITAFISITPIDPAAPDDIPDRLRDISAIEECHSVAGDENYILKVRVANPSELEDLIAQVRGAAHVSTRTTVVLSTPWE